MRAALCDLLALAGAALFSYGLYRAWAPGMFLFLGAFLYWFAFVLRGRTQKRNP